MNFIKSGLARARLEHLMPILAAASPIATGDKKKSDGEKKKKDKNQSQCEKKEGEEGACEKKPPEGPDCVAAHVPKPCIKTCPPKNTCMDTEGGRDKAAAQLTEFKKLHACPIFLTTSQGAPIACKTASLTAGSTGPMLMQDFIFTDEIAHFNREKIPERVTNAKGAGAYGQFEVTHDITKYCKASLFQKVGKKTPVVVRFSTVTGGSSSADTVRDPRGFAVKFYTDDGNWDLVGNNTPIYFIRDPILYPSFIHSQRRNPVTNLKDYDMFWDFISLRPETTQQVAFMFSDRGIPDGFRFMNGYGCHTYKMVNKEGKAYYCKFHFKSDQGIKNLKPEDAERIAGIDPDYATRDLYNAIACKECISWTLFIQVMPLEEAENAQGWNPFDITKVWPHGTYPLIQVGKLCLNRNPKNYFAEVEQLAFSPAHFVPGIEASPDRLLQGRIQAYADAHRYRIGVNYATIPVNCPYKTKVNNYMRDGTACMDSNQDGAPNYFPNSFAGPIEQSVYIESPVTIVDKGARYMNADEDNFTQTGIFYQTVLKEDERDRLAQNIAKHLRLAQCFIRERVIANFKQADIELGTKISDIIDSTEKKDKCEEPKVPCPCGS